MLEMTEREYLRWFAGLHLDNELLSTGATKVDYPGVLYNVTRSTKDPKRVPGHRNKSWKKILIDVAELDDDEECYVTNQKPGQGEGRHPDFEVGGHMTPEGSGVVEKGGVTYLMPLCKWHNSTKRNGKPFSHTKSTVVKLSGFMEGDSPLTFMMRMPSNERFSALYIDPATEELNFRDLPDSEVLGRNLKSTILASEKGSVADFALFERDDLNGGMYRIKEISLS